MEGARSFMVEEEGWGWAEGAGRWGGEPGRAWGSEALRRRSN